VGKCQLEIIEDKILDHLSLIRPSKPSYQFSSSDLFVHSKTKSSDNLPRFAAIISESPNTSPKLLGRLKKGIELLHPPRVLVDLGPRPESPKST
jgi:hypothetical protein